MEEELREEENKRKKLWRSSNSSREALMENSQQAAISSSSIGSGGSCSCGSKRPDTEPAANLIPNWLKAFALGFCLAGGLTVLAIKNEGFFTAQKGSK